MHQAIEHNGRLHASAATTVGLVVLTVALGGWYTTLGKLPTCVVPTALGHVMLQCHDSLDDFTAIDASLAYKKPDQKQPEKKHSAPPPEVKPEGVSHDENKVPDKTKPPPPENAKANPTPDELYKQFHHTDSDDDNEVGKPTQDTGDFNGSEFGYATETKGDPYFQKLVGDLVQGWDYPKLLSETGTPIGCLHLSPDGKIADTLFKTKSGNAELDDSVDRALKALQKLRNDPNNPPDAVPTHLLAQTEKWICFKFTVPDQ